MLADSLPSNPEAPPRLVGLDLYITFWKLIVVIPDCSTFMLAWLWPPKPILEQLITTTEVPGKTEQGLIIISIRVVAHG